MKKQTAKQLQPDPNENLNIQKEIEGIDAMIKNHSTIVDDLKKLKAEKKAQLKN